MNRRKFLRDASKLLGLAALAPFTPKVDEELVLDQESLEDEFTDDLDKQAGVLPLKGLGYIPYYSTSATPYPDYEWVAMHEGALEAGWKNSK